VLLMVAAQFMSQKFTMPSNQQNKMLGYLMPLFMGFIFYSFAAGLVWVTSCRCSWVSSSTVLPPAWCYTGQHSPY